jgi:hypothetical protein
VLSESSQICNGLFASQVVLDVAQLIVKALAKDNKGFKQILGN